MKTARVFTNGRSQAVRLPKEYRLRGKDVYIREFQGLVLLIPKTNPWASLIASLELFSSDFMVERLQPSDKPRASM